jgi:hypothetical protein
MSRQRAVPVLVVGEGKQKRDIASDGITSLAEYFRGAIQPTMGRCALVG